MVHVLKPGSILWVLVGRCNCRQRRLCAGSEEVEHFIHSIGLSDISVSQEVMERADGSSRFKDRSPANLIIYI